MKPVTRRHTLRLTLSGVAALPLLAAASRPARAQQVHVVEIRDFAFNPQELEAKPGDMIEFRNMDGAPHTATASNGGFDTGLINPGKAARIQIPGNDAFEYFCRIHPSMQGVIVA
jgi:plastocyanin